MPTNQWFLAVLGIAIASLSACSPSVTRDGEGSSAAALTDSEGYYGDDPYAQPSGGAAQPIAVGAYPGTSPQGNASSHGDCVDLINQYRASAGLPALQRAARAETCLDQEAQSDSQTGSAHGAFGQCGEVAQNECPGWPGAIQDVLTGCLQSMWNEGPGGGHYDNMTSQQYTIAACGIAQTQTGEFWVVQDFR
jgi:hypothetical protein